MLPALVGGETSHKDEWSLASFPRFSCLPEAALGNQADPSDTDGPKVGLSIPKQPTRWCFNPGDEEQ
jgi:hypothetical protein